MRWWQMWFEGRRPTVVVDDASAFHPAVHVSTATHEGGTVLLDLEQQRYYGLDEVGGAIWGMVKEGACVGEIADRLSAEYDAPREVLVVDTCRFLTELVNSGLVAAS